MQLYEELKSAIYGGNGSHIVVQHGVWRQLYIALMPLAVAYFPTSLPRQYRKR